MASWSMRAAVDPARAAENNLPILLGITATFHALAWVFVSLRVYTRRVLVKCFGKDDAFMVIALFFVCGGGMVTLAMAGTYGWGRHNDTLSKSDANNYQKMMLFHGIFSSITAFMFIKISIALSLLRLQGSDNRYRYFLWGLIAFIIAYTIVGWISWAISCFPIAGYWDKSVPASCIPTDVFSVFSYTNTVCNIMTDFILATLPIPMIWRLQMARRSRIYLIAIFSAGYLTCTMGILKVVFQFSPQHKSPDRTFIDHVRVFGFLEANMGIIVACAPTLKRLVGGWLNLSTQRPGNYGYGYGQSAGSQGGRRANVSQRGHGYIQTTESKDAELDDIEMGGRYHAQKGDAKGGFTATAYPTSLESRSGSHERILPGGIVMTREVHVEPEKAEVRRA